MAAATATLFPTRHILPCICIVAAAIVFPPSPPGHGPRLPPASWPPHSASDHWGNWTVLLAIAALGIWSEKKTQAGKALSGALVSVLVGLAASSAGIVSAYRVVLDYLLPLAIPLLLFTADLRFTGILLFAFLLRSLATTIGTIVAFLLVPMRSLGQDN